MEHEALSRRIARGVADAPRESIGFCSVGYQCNYIDGPVPAQSA